MPQTGSCLFIRVNADALEGIFGPFHGTLQKAPG